MTNPMSSAGILPAVAEASRLRTVQIRKALVRFEHLSSAQDDSAARGLSPGRCKNTISQAEPTARYPSFDGENLCRTSFHSSVENSRGPTSISRGVILKSATRVQGLPFRIRKPFSFRSLTMLE